MTTPAERHLSTATTFGEVVNATTDWDAPSPVPEWSARDVVGHLAQDRLMAFIGRDPQWQRN